MSSRDTLAATRVTSWAGRSFRQASPQHHYLAPIHCGESHIEITSKVDH